MKRFLSISFTALALAVVIVGTSVDAPTAHAQDSIYTDDGVTGSTDAPALDTVSGNGTMSITPISPTAASTKTETDPNLGKDAEKFGPVMGWIMSLFAWLVGVAALVLDNAVYFTVVKMGDYVHKLSAVGVTWKIFRDIGNIMLIFGFLAAGIMTILNTTVYGWGKKMIPMLLVAAVLLNFSLFVAEAVVDTGNLFATQFYTQINGGVPAGAKEFDQGFSIRLTNEGISSKIMSQLGMQTIYGEAKRNVEIFKAGNTWIIGFMAILLFIVTAFVMFSLAFILIARFVILLFLIIVAPVGFAGLAVPKLEATAKKWWSTLFEQTITAPILLLLLYVALAVITDAQFLTGLCISTDPTNATCKANALGWVSGNFQGFASFMLSFLIAMGLLLAVVIMSKKMSAFGAGWATKTAGGLSFGAVAWAGRNSGGWLANNAARGLRKTAFARVPLVGTGLVRGLEGVAGSSFDVRGVKRFGGLKAAGIEAGDAQKGGYKAALKKRVESRTKYAADLKGKDFKDLSPEDKLALANLEKDLGQKKKDLKDARTPLEYQRIFETIDRVEKDIDAFHMEKGTERGNKLNYADTLSKLVLASNTDAAKKIKEEAKKSRDDRELDTLRKALKKASGEEEEGGAPPSVPPAGGGGGSGGTSNGGTPSAGTTPS